MGSKRSSRDLTTAAKIKLLAIDEPDHSYYGTSI
jgi:hypothetical protein